MAKTSKPTKKRVVKVEPLGRACIFASFNNVIISLTNNAGQVISWSSAGKMGFRGSKKNTPYAAQWLWHRSNRNRRRHSASSQRLPSPQTPSRVIRKCKNFISTNFNPFTFFSINYSKL